jgi:hypothetical protein
MFSNSTVIWVVRSVIAMKRLGAGTRADAERDGIVNLRNTDALLVLVTDLNSLD